MGAGFHTHDPEDFKKRFIICAVLTIPILILSATDSTDLETWLTQNHYKIPPGAEPAALRAIQEGYDPYRQVTARLSQLKQIGHELDKVELIVMGGTITAQTAVDPNQTDMSSVLADIAAGAPEMIYFPIFQPAGPLIIQQAKKTSAMANVMLRSAVAPRKSG